MATRGRPRIGRLRVSANKWSFHRGSRIPSQFEAALPLAEYEPTSMLHAQEKYTSIAPLSTLATRTGVLRFRQDRNAVALAAQRTYLGSPGELVSVNGPQEYSHDGKSHRA